MEEEKKTTSVAAKPAADDPIEKAEALTDKAEESAPKTDNASEEDSALESFLSREQESKKNPKPAKRRKPLLIVLAAVAVVAILVVVLILLRSHPAPASDETTAAEITFEVTDGVHEAAVPVDDNGNIQQNGSGALLSYVPADIKQIDVENTDGSFSVVSETPEGEATVYKVVGFEDYSLQEGVADEIANKCASLEFIRVISADGKLADYGLEEPRAKVTVQYNDDTTAVFRVGDEAAGEDTGTYVAFGESNAVFLVSNDNVKNFLYSINSLISLEITATNEDSDNAEFSTLTISGTHFDEPITLVPNTDEAIEASYLVTSPVKMAANAVEASDIAGNVRGLYAESVVCVNPSADQLASYGLSKPYATVKASYPDTDITLDASAPDESGVVYIYNPDTNVIYTIQLAAVCWAKTSVDLLLPENPLNAKLKYVDSIHFTAGSADYDIDVETTTDTTTDDSGNEQEVSNSTATCDGKDLNTEYFNVFFQNLNAIKNQGKTDKTGKDQVMSVTYRYTTDRADDTLTVYTGDATHYILELNGDPIGTATKSYINNLIEGADNLIKGEPVAGL